MLYFSSIHPSDIKSNGSVCFKANDNWTPVSKAYSSNTFVKLLRKKRVCLLLALLCRRAAPREKKCPLFLELGWILKMKSDIGNGALPPSFSHRVAVQDGHTVRIITPQCSFFGQNRKMAGK